MLLPDGRYKQKGKTYSSFSVWACIEGCKIFFVLSIALFFVLLPFLLTGKLQRTVEGAWFHAVTSHFTSAPSQSQKGVFIQEATQDARDAGIPSTLFVRQIALESGFDPNVVSSAGAVGIAQFMPDTAARLGIDPYNPHNALRGAAFLMARYQHNYGSYEMALATYNGGTGRLNDCIETYKENWLSCEPAETRNYIAVIMS